MAQLVRICLQCERPGFNCWFRKIIWRTDRLPMPLFLGFPGGSVGKEFACNVGDLGSIPGLGRSPGKGNSYPLQYSGLENSMDCVVHGATKRLSDFHFHHFPRWLCGKESTCQTGDVGSIPDSGRSPGGGNGNPLQDSCLENSMSRGTWQVTIQYMRLQRVRHDLACTHTYT